MTVKQLIQALSNYPDNMDVFLAERKTDFAFGLLNSVIAKKVTFSEEEDGGGHTAKDTVVILDEE